MLFVSKLQGLFFCICAIKGILVPGWLIFSPTVKNISYFTHHDAYIISLFFLSFLVWWKLAFKIPGSSSWKEKKIHWRKFNLFHIFWREAFLRELYRNFSPTQKEQFQLLKEQIRVCSLTPANLSPLGWNPPERLGAVTSGIRTHNPTIQGPHSLSIQSPIQQPFHQKPQPMARSS